MSNARTKRWMILGVGAAPQVLESPIPVYEEQAVHQWLQDYVGADWTAFVERFDSEGRFLVGFICRALPLEDAPDEKAPARETSPAGAEQAGDRGGGRDA